MKRDIREKNYISGETATGITVETTQYFATREEMHQAAREAMKNGTEYPEIILDTWDCVKIDFSGFDDMEKTEIKNFIWIPVFASEDEKNIQDTLKIYENVGAVFHEKSVYYSFGEADGTAKENNEIVVAIPDGWEVFRSFSGKDMISTPYGYDIELCQALSCIDGMPALKTQNRNGEITITMLEII